MPTDLLVDRYRVIRTLGQGAMGEVWLVEDTTSGERLALKAIAGPLAADERTRLQFKQEFRLMTQLRHPNCCAVYDYGVLEDGRPYFTMEVVPGEGLDERLPLPGARFADVLVQLARALAYVHQLGFVHRDLKPANVRVTPDGVVKLMDYGLMEHAGRAGGTLTGTLPYVSPEMARRGPIDQRSDLYSLGALAYELLVGQPPFVAASAVEVLRAHLAQPPAPPSSRRAGVDAGHERVVLRLLAKEPIERYQHAQEVIAALGGEPGGEVAGALLQSPLEGRDAALGDLEARVARLAAEARAGQAATAGGLCAITGPTGIGKSRLLAALRPAAQLAEVACGGGAAAEHAATPYGPFLGALRELLPALRQHAPAALAQQAAVLARLLPELEAACGVAAAPELETPMKEQLRLHAAIAAVLAALARARGLVLLLEGWQWADPPSAHLLAHLGHALAGLPALAVVATRGGAADLPPGATALALGPLDEAAVGRLVANMLGLRDPDPAFVRAAAEHSGGNPLHLERLLAYLVGEGRLVRRDGRWDTAAAVPTAEAPRNHAQALQAIVAGLDDDAATLARIAAAAGDLALDVLQTASGLPDEALFAAIERLVRARLLVPADEGGWRFARGEYAEALYAAIGSQERPLFHALIAEALERRLDPMASAPPLELVTAIAHHYLRAPASRPAIHYALEAGTRHARLYATTTARELLAAGLALVRRAPDPAAWDAERLAFLATLGDVERTLGDLAAARAAYEEALPLAVARGDGARHGRLLGSLAKVHQQQGDADRAAALLPRAIEASLAAGDQEGAARGLVASGLAHFLGGRTAEAVADADRGLALARASGHRGRTGAALALAGYLRATTDPGRRAEGIAMLEEAVAIQEALGDRSELLTPLAYKGSLELHAGALADAEATFRRMREATTEIGAHEEELTASFNLALVALQRGRPAAAAREAAAVAGRAARHAQPFWVVLADGLAAEALARAGLPAEAAATADRAVAAAEALGVAYARAYALPHVVSAHLALGRSDEALAGADALAGIVARTGLHELAPTAAALRGAALDRLGRTAEARAAFAEAAEAAAKAGSPLLEARARLGLARLEMRAEAWDAAAAHARAALATGEGLGAALLAAEAEAALGEWALATGDPGAAGWFEAMARRAEAAEAPDLVARAAFGRAAANPVAPGAKALAAGAKARVEALAAPLDEAARAAFVAVPARRCILAGDYADFGRVRVAKVAGSGPLGMAGGLGMW